MSVPELVSVGATPEDHFTEDGNVIECAPPFVMINVNDPAAPDAGGFRNASVKLPPAVKV